MSSNVTQKGRDLCACTFIYFMHPQTSVFFQALPELEELELMTLLITAIGIGERLRAKHTLHNLLQCANDLGFPQKTFVLQSDI